MTQSEVGRPRVVLVGAGHAHLEVMRQHALEPLAAAVELISSGPAHHYSGMVPGYLTGTYSEEEIAFDLESLAHRAGVRFRQGTAVGIDPRARAVAFADGSVTSYDFVSFNVGSQTAGADAPAVSDHAVLVKPMSEAVRLRERLEALIRDEDVEVPSVAVVGAGAAGVEVACSAAARLRRSGRPHQLTLVDAGDDILPGYSTRFRFRALRVLRQKAIRTITRARVVGVDDRGVTLDSGQALDSMLTIWLTGAVAWPIFQASGLSCDRRGFLLTTDTLTSVDDGRVLAVGDCGTLADHPDTPKAGVYAVRQGPVLATNLRHLVAGSPLVRYSPQRGFLSLLNTADGKTLLRYGRVVSWSRWAWRLKDSIDRRFMRKYQSLSS